jgi:hypothetical protein
MEDVCELSALLQEENVEKELQEGDILQLESSINIEQNRYLQEKASLKDMIKSRERVKNRTLHVSDMLDLLLSSLDGKLHPVFCASVQSILCPQKTDFLNHRHDVISTTELLLSDVEELEKSVIDCKQKIDSGIRHEVTALESNLSKRRTVLNNISEDVRATKTAINGLVTALLAIRQDMVDVRSDISASLEQLRLSENDLLRIDTILEKLGSGPQKTRLSDLGNRDSVVNLIEHANGEHSSLLVSQGILDTDLQDACMCLASSTVRWGAAGDRVSLIESFNRERNEALVQTHDAIHREGTALRSTQGTLEISNNGISSQFSIARAYAENLTLNSSAQNIHGDNCVLVEISKELSTSLKNIEEKVCTMPILIYWK